MRKAYILVYSDSLGSRNQVKECLSSIDIIATWRYDMPNSFYLISESNATEISREIRKRLGKGRFLISEINDNRHGWLLPTTWHLIKNKRHKK